MGCAGTWTHDLLHEKMMCQPLGHIAAIKFCHKDNGLILLNAYKLSNWLITKLSIFLVYTLEVIKLQMAAELPAIVVHSILEIVRWISYEGKNVEIRGFSRQISVNGKQSSL